MTSRPPEKLPPGHAPVNPADMSEPLLTVALIMPEQPELEWGKRQEEFGPESHEHVKS